MALDVSGLTSYVKEQETALISKAVLGAKTLDYISIQTGVKYQAGIHTLAVAPSIQAGSCAFSASGDAVFTERVITAPALKVNMEFCELDMLGKYGEWEVNLAAGRENLPFEERITADITKKVAREVETLIWSGSAGLSVSGIAMFSSEFTVASGASTASTVYDGIKEVYSEIPVEVLDNAMIFVSEGTYRALVQELVAANLYHFDAQYGEREIYLPGTSTRIVAVPGLNDVASGKMVIAADPKNLFWGVDLRDDAETFDLWYSKDNQIFRLAIKFNGGAQVAFPAEVAYGVLA